MPTRNLEFEKNEYYHVFNRGVSKQNIFNDQRDWVRFLFLILYSQTQNVFNNTGRKVTDFIKHGSFRFRKEQKINSRFVSLVSFSLMSNHFHLIVCAKTKDGISKYMQKILASYTKYYNEKYKHSGHLFQGPFKAVHVSNNNQLLYLSTYIHRNPRELKNWKRREHEYPWSSFQDYIQKNRWGKFLECDVILDQFENQLDYRKFVETSPAKENEVTDPY